MSPAVENVIETPLENRFFTRQRLWPVHVARDVQLRCREDGLPVPSERTIRRRIRDLPEELHFGADSDTRQHRLWRRCEEGFLKWTNRSA